MHKGEQLMPSDLLGDFSTLSHSEKVSELERLAEIIDQSGAGCLCA